MNLLGNPNNFNKINALIEDKDIILLEDNCESMGAKFKEKYTGTFGLMGTFSSFYSTILQPWKVVAYLQMMKRFIIFFMH